MLRPWLVMVLLVLALAAAGQAVSAAPQPLPLTARVTTRDELPGFTPAQVRTFTTPAAFLAAYQTEETPAQRSAWIALLKREALVAVATEDLQGTSNGTWGGLSWAMELGSAADARSELLQEVRSDESHGPAARFDVTGIPDASAFHEGTGAGGGDNILFSDGRFLYFVGEGWNTSPRPARAALIAAARSLYRRVHGHPVA